MIFLSGIFFYPPISKLTQKKRDAAERDISSRPISSRAGQGSAGLVQTINKFSADLHYQLINKLVVDIF